MPRDRPTLYYVAIKTGLYRKAVQVYHIHVPITTSLETHNSVHLKFSNPAINFYCKNDFLYIYFIHLTKYVPVRILRLKEIKLTSLHSTIFRE